MVACTDKSYVMSTGLMMYSVKQILWESMD